MPLILKRKSFDASGIILRCDRKYGGYQNAVSGLHGRKTGVLEALCLTLRKQVDAEKSPYPLHLSRHCVIDALRPSAHPMAALHILKEIFTFLFHNIKRYIYIIC